MPVMNAASFLLQLNAITSAVKSDCGVTSDLKMSLGDSADIEIQYQMPDPDLRALEGKGTIAGHAVDEAWWYNDDEGGWSVGGQIGDRFENLLITTSQNGNLHLRGSIDRIKVNETITPKADGSVDFSGTVGGQTLHQTLTFGVDDAGNETMQVRGALGDQAISFDEAVSSDGKGLHCFSGEGLIAGTRVKMSDSLELKPRKDDHRS